MDFTDLLLLFFFLPVSLMIYYFGREQLKKYILLAVSLFFYACGMPDCFLLLIFSLSINLLVGYIIAKNLDKKIISVCFLVAGIGFNVIVLGYYKYFDFITVNMNHLFGTSFSLRNIILPLGLSFYTFKAISYLIDIYKGTIIVNHNPVYGALYLSFFAQIQSGPLSRYNEMYSNNGHGTGLSSVIVFSGGIPIYNWI